MTDREWSLIIHTRAMHVRDVMTTVVYPFAQNANTIDCIERPKPSVRGSTQCVKSVDIVGGQTVG
jgi:hypothetical protein